MQTEISTLPLVHLNVQANINRKQNTNASNRSGVGNHPLSRNMCPPMNKRRLHPLIGGPYKNSVRLHSVEDQTKPANKNAVIQEVVSAKMLRIKQLQNQLADAHYHLNELANENRLLKALQKKQDSALKRYEGTNAELPKIINSHHEELRALQANYKKLKALHKESCNLLKEKENELYSLQSQNKHLLKLSKDRNLEEREKLQLQVSNLNRKILQQQETIQQLQKKLTLQNKSWKHRLHLEIAKHKETQKHLQDAFEKLKSLENLINKKEKKQYCCNQLSSYDKDKILESQSLTNLRNISIIPNSPNKYKKNYIDTKRNSLPLLATPETTNDEIVGHAIDNVNQKTSLFNSEMTTNLQEVQKLDHHKLSHYTDAFLLANVEQKPKQVKRKLSNDTKMILHNENDISNQKSTSQFYKTTGYTSTEKESAYNISKELETQFNYLSDSTDSENENDDELCSVKNLAKVSQELHARLISNVESISDIDENEFSKIKEENVEKYFQEELKPSSFKLCETEMNAMSEEKDYCESDTEGVMTMNKKLSKNGYFIERNNNKLESVLPDFCCKDATKIITDIIGMDVEISKFLCIKANANCDEAYKEGSESLLSFENKEAAIDRDSTNSIVSWVEIENKLVTDTYSYKSQHNFSVDKETEFYLTKDKADSSKHDLGLTHMVHLQGDTNTININQDTLLKKNNNNNSDSTLRLMQSAFEKNEKIELTELNLNNENEHLEVSKGSMLSYHNGLHEKNDLNQKNLIIPIFDDNKASSNKTGIESNEESTSEINILISTTDDYIKSRSNTRSVPRQIEKSHDINDDSSFDKNTTKKSKSFNYNKEKLLATMKAIDNNENIEFLTQQNFPKRNSTNKTQIMENLFRGLPAYNRKNNDNKDICDNDKVDHKIKGNCGKLH